MRTWKTLLILTLPALFLVGAWFAFPHSVPDPDVGRVTRPVDISLRPPTSSTVSVPALPAVAASSTDPAPSRVLSSPISDAISRVTKKPFGLFVTPKISPVQPEKFTGFHTGVDFETTSSEANSDVPIRAVCDGELLVKRAATGYGGVAVQSCAIDGQAVTVIYGHLRLSSIMPKVGDHLAAGETFAVLGAGYSSETDGERKHLHLGIHKGTSVNILGYVQKMADLAKWIDPLPLLK